MKLTKSADEFFANQDHRRMELAKLRAILKRTELVETVKWGMPTYTISGKNIVGIGAFNKWSCLWFHEGSLLKDEESVLINAQEGKTKALRQWRFKSIEDINGDQIRKYLNEAIQNHKAGLRVKFPKKKIKKEKELVIPDLLLDSMTNDNALRNSFEGLTYPQRRDYIEYINEPKRESTKKTRIEKIIPLIKSSKPLATIWMKS